VIIVVIKERGVERAGGKGRKTKAWSTSEHKGGMPSPVYKGRGQVVLFINNAAHK
jgi:hypothetical protein